MSLFLFIPYFIGARLSKNYCQKWEFGNKKKWRRGGGGRLSIEWGFTPFCTYANGPKNETIYFCLFFNGEFKIQYTKL